MVVVPRAHDIAISLIGFETHKARPDLTDDSGFWLRVKAEDASPFIASVICFTALNSDAVS